MPQCYLVEHLVEEGTGGSSGQSGPDVLSSPCPSQQQSGCVLLSHRTEEVLKPLLPWCISGCRDGSQTSFTAAKSAGSYAQPLFTRDLRWRWSLFHSRIPWAHSITSKAIRLSDVSSSTRLFWGACDENMAQAYHAFLNLKALSRARQPPPWLLGQCK